MPGSPEDQRAAASFNASLSGQLLAVAIGFLAFAGAVDTYLIDKRSVGACFYTLTLVAVLLMLVGMFSGGQAIRTLSRNGYLGDWCLEKPRKEFSYQAFLSVLGVILFFCSWLVAVGPEKTDAGQEKFMQRLESLEKNVSSLQQQLDAVKSQKK